AFVAGRPHIHKIHLSNADSCMSAREKIILQGRLMRVSGNAPFWVFTKKFWSFARLKVTASVIAAPLAGTIVLSTATGSLADEGGVSFWVPGFFGSLAATPQVPGFSLANVFYYNQVSAGGNVAFAKQVPLGRINVTFNGISTATVHGSAEPLYLAL